MIKGLPKEVEFLAWFVVFMIVLSILSLQYMANRRLSRVDQMLADRFKLFEAIEHEISMVETNQAAIIGEQNRLKSVVVPDLDKRIEVEKRRNDAVDTRQDASDRRQDASKKREPK